MSIKITDWQKWLQNWKEYPSCSVYELPRAGQYTVLSRQAIAEAGPRESGGGGADMGHHATRISDQMER
jgi:hypothetical protein